MQQFFSSPFYQIDVLVHLVYVAIIENHNEMSISARSRAINFFDIKKWYKDHSELFEDLLSHKR